MATGAVETEAIEFAPLAAEADLDTAFDEEHEAHAELLEKRKQRLVGKSTIGCEPHPLGLDGLKDQLERPFGDGAFIEMRPALERVLVVGAPIDRDGASADDQRDSEQVLRAFARPVPGETDVS